MKKLYNIGLKEGIFKYIVSLKKRKILMNSKKDDEEFFCSELNNFLKNKI